MTEVTQQGPPSSPFLCLGRDGNDRHLQWKSLFLHRIWNVSWTHQLLDPSLGLERDSDGENESPTGTSPRLYSQDMRRWTYGFKAWIQKPIFLPTILPRNLFPTKAQRLSCMYTASIHQRTCYVRHFRLPWRVWRNSFCMAFLKFFSYHARHMPS